MNIFHNIKEAMIIHGLIAAKEDSKLKPADIESVVLHQ